MSRPDLPGVLGSDDAGFGRVLVDDIAAVKAARAYTVEHFGFSKHSYTGRMSSDEFDHAVDHIAAFADKAVELLGLVLATEKLGPGISEDIAYVLGRIKRWVCQDCGCANGAHEGFCYRCGAGPEEDA